MQNCNQILIVKSGPDPSVTEASPCQTVHSRAFAQVRSARVRVRCVRACVRARARASDCSGRHCGAHTKTVKETARPTGWLFRGLVMMAGLLDAASVG